MRIPSNILSSSKKAIPPGWVNSLSRSRCMRVRRLGNEVPRVIGEEGEPLLVAMRVEQGHLVVVETLDLVLADRRCDTLLGRL
jgi:hypothetical protein